MGKREPKTCYQKWRCRCSHHDMKCGVPVEFHPSDTRAAFVNRMSQQGAGKHNEDSEHRCWMCDRERQEGRRAGYYKRDPVDGKFKPTPLMEKLEKDRAERKAIIEKAKSRR